MIKYLKIIFGLLIFSLMGCVSEETQNAALESAATIKAKSYKVGKGSFAGTDNESYKSLNIEFSDFEELPDKYDNEKLSSIAALVFFKNLKAHDYSGFDKIKVTLNIKNTIVESLYDIKTLSIIDDYLKVSEDLITSFKEKSFEAMQQCIDTTMIPTSDQDGIYNIMMKIDSAYGKINNYTFTGFKLKESTNNKNPDFVIWCVLQHDNAETYLELIVNRATKKIIYIEINGE